MTSKIKEKLKFVQAKDTGVMNTQEDSPRSSFYYEPSMLATEEWTTTFHFIDWPHYSETLMLSITIGSTSFKVHANEIFVLHYIRGKPDFVQAMIKQPTGAKLMSVVTFSNYSPLLCIDAIMNDFKQVDPPGFVYIHYVPQTPDEYEENKRNISTFVHWGPIKIETTRIDTASMSVDTLTDIPKWHSSYYQLR